MCLSHSHHTFLVRPRYHDTVPPHRHILPLPPGIYFANLVRPLLLSRSRPDSTTTCTAPSTATASTPLHLFVFGLEEAQADEQTAAQEAEDGHVDACHAGGEGRHTDQEEARDGVPDEGDEGDATPGGEEVLYEGHGGDGTGKKQGRHDVESGGYDDTTQTKQNE